MYQDLLELLYALHGVRQNPRWHPEGDALFHSLQVFNHALKDTNDCALWAAALLHDVGKAIGGSYHDEHGADLLDGLVSPRIVWLVRHHLDLVNHPKKTLHRWHGHRVLCDLRALRKWDVGGRERFAKVMKPEDALDHIFSHADLTVVGADGESSPDFSDRQNERVELLES